MLILKDFICKSCGGMREATTAVAVPALFCEECQEVTHHTSACTGGCKSRWRHNDWSGVDFTGSVTVGKPEAYFENDDGTEAVCKRKDGTPVEDSPRFNQDNLNEKHEKVRSRFKREAGSMPIIIDRGRSPGE